MGTGSAPKAIVLLFSLLLFFPLLFCEADQQHPRQQQEPSVHQLQEGIHSGDPWTSATGTFEGFSIGSPGMGVPEWFPARDRKLLQVSPATGFQYDIVVALDGSGNYASISAALAAAPDNSAQRFIIYIKQGTYKEYVEVNKPNVMLIGEGAEMTIISGCRNAVDNNISTFYTATLAVNSDGFIARDLTIENTSGPEKQQAVAMRSKSDESAYYNCTFSGYQDTLYLRPSRQFYRDCRISGTVDYIFGDGAVVFQGCTLFSRRPIPGQVVTITAQGSLDPRKRSGFSFQYCNVIAESPEVVTFLGRPWNEYAMVVFMESFLDSTVHRDGWMAWEGSTNFDKLYYGEYLNYGPGSSTNRRVKWPGFHIISDPSKAVNFNVDRFIDGNLWLPSTGIPYSTAMEDSGFVIIAGAALYEVNNFKFVLFVFILLTF